MYVVPKVRSIAVGLLLFFILGSLLFCGIKISFLLKKVSNSSEGNAKILSRLENSVSTIGDDLNNTRELLGLRTREYISSDETEEQLSEEDPVPLHYPEYYRAVDFLIEDFNESRIKALLSSFLEGDGYDALYKKYELIPKEKDKKIGIYSGERLFYTIYAEPGSSGGFAAHVEKFDSSESEEIKSPSDLELFIKKYNGEISAACKASDDLIRETGALIRSGRVVSSLKEKNLFIKTRPADPEKWGFDIKRSDGSSVCDVAVNYGDTSASVAGEKGYDIDSLEERLLHIERFFDIRTAAEKKVDENLAELSRLAEDSAFKKFLDVRGYSISPVPKEDKDYYDFVLSGKDGLPAGSISLRKNTGELYLFDSDNVMITSMDSVEAGLVKKN